MNDQKQGSSRYLYAIGAMIAAYFGYRWWKSRQIPEATPTPPATDITIDSVAITPSGTLGRGVPYTATVTITNPGDTDGSIELWMGWTMDDFPGEYRIYTTSNPQTVSVPAGQSVQVTRNGTTIGSEDWAGAIWANDHEGTDGAVSAPLVVSAG
jgi:hypothetical protein